MSEIGGRVINLWTGLKGVVVATNGGCTVVLTDGGHHVQGDFRAWMPWDKDDPPEMPIRFQNRESDAYKRGFDDGRMAGKREANEPVANRLGLHAMYGNHTFHKFTHVTSPDDLTHQWIAMGGGRENDIVLCPVIVLNGKQELRRVGRMLFDANEVEKVEAFKAALLADPDVVRLMAETQEAGEQP